MREQNTPTPTSQPQISCPSGPSTAQIPPLVLSYPFSTLFELHLEQLVCVSVTRYIRNHVYIASNPSILQSYNMRAHYFLLCPHPNTLAASNLPSPHLYPFFDHPLLQYQLQPLKIQGPVKVEEDIPPQQPCKQEEPEQERVISRFKYAKKNVESNVVNQCLSYLATRAKSYSMVRRILKEEDRVQLFYAVLREGRKKLAKYMGRSVLQSLLQLEYEHPVHVAFRKMKGRQLMRIAEVRKALRMLAHYFLRSLAIPSILSSHKLDKLTLREHVARVRQITEHLTLAACIYF